MRGLPLLPLFDWTPRVSTHRYGILQYLRQRRFVSITGSAGLGKTALAVATANYISERATFKHGICFVRLHGCRTMQGFAAALHSALRSQPCLAPVLANFAQQQRQQMHQHGSPYGYMEGYGFSIGGMGGHGMGGHGMGMGVSGGRGGSGGGNEAAIRRGEAAGHAGGLQALEHLFSVFAAMREIRLLVIMDHCDDLLVSLFDRLFDKMAAPFLHPFSTHGSR